MIEYVDIKTGATRYFNPANVEDVELVSRKMSELGAKGGKVVDKKVLLIWMVSGKALWVDPKKSEMVNLWLDGSSLISTKHAIDRRLIEAREKMSGLRVGGKRRVNDG